MSKIVIALGGNALGDSPQEQLDRAVHAAHAITDLIEAGHQVVVVHGNGPQVGMIHKGLESAAQEGTISVAMPLPECGAMSQGYIGYHLQNALRNELDRRGLSVPVAAVVTQVLVEETDPAFSHPTKPIGAFYTAQQAQEMSRAGCVMVEDSGRGYRRVVASPAPVDVVEKETVSALMAVGQVVITAGGGGIPVVRKDGALVGVPAVIDKDLASAKLAELIGAELLIILTAVERVAVNFGKPDQKDLAEMDLVQAQEYIEQGQFAPGSMLPKVQAAMSFARKGGRTIIAALERAPDAVKGLSGTVIHA
jgi:carbamate kinase